MRFPNAFGGVKKIWLAEILGLIGMVCSLITAILAAGSVAGAMVAESEEGLAAAGLGLAGTGLFGLGAGVLAILQFIFNLVGLNQAGKDEANFKRGFYAALIGIAVSIIGAFFSGNQTASTVFTMLSNVIEIFIFFSVVQGVKVLAEQMGDQEIANRGDTILKIFIGVYAVAILVSLISLFAASVASVMSIVAAIAAIVGYVLYISYLSKAKKMLAA